jgi:hypothetical protein
VQKVYGDLEADALKELLAKKKKTVSAKLRRTAVSFLSVVESLRQSYNYERLHSSLTYPTPAEFVAAWRLVSSTMERSSQPLR